MGVAAGTDGEIEASLREAEARPWRELLPPVLIVKETETPRVRLSLPDGTREVGWRFTSEAGDVAEGRAETSRLEAAEETLLEGRIYRAYHVVPGVSPGLGYHTFEITAVDGGPGSLRPMALIVTPAVCFRRDRPPGDGREWGISCQIYSLRSDTDWGCGNFSDLGHFMETWGEFGASLVAVNPVHALLPNRPGEYSPYRPSNRRFHNFMYLDIESVEDFSESERAKQLYNSEEFQARLAALSAQEYLDGPGVAAAKLEMLDLLFEYFRERQLGKGTPRARRFVEYTQARGEDLLRHAAYQALAERFAREKAEAQGWQDWPPEFRDFGSPAVQGFMAEHNDRVQFYQYLQWLTEEQLLLVRERARQSDTGPGLFMDVAVGAAAGGSEVWADKDLYAAGMTIGSPPDDFDPAGRTWGLPPLLPENFRRSGYRSFRELLRENMRHADTIRLEHVAGLLRLYWVPEGLPANEGAYIHYPLQDLFGLLALESVRNRCMVVGEDLGAVPEEIRAAMREYGILTCRVFFLEQDAGGAYKPPGEYPEDALVVAGTHDLPALAGYWQGRDLALRNEHGGIPDERTLKAQLMARSRDWAALLVALEKETLLPAGVSAQDPASVPGMDEELVKAVHVYLARTPSRLLMARIEDVLGDPEQTNLPGVMGYDLNWRRRLSLKVRELSASLRVQGFASALRQVRGRETAAALVARIREALAAQIPAATYRLQFNDGFTFKDATAILPYLSDLGVSHVYSSPLLRTHQGSLHGYDIIDHSSLNPGIGSVDDFERMVGELKRRGMGQIMDMVPNHMAVFGSHNAWWLDVLENGQASVYAAFFDIEWHPVNVQLFGKLHLPILGDQYGNVLERGELKLAFDPKKGTLAVHYAEHTFPIDPMRYPLVLSHRIDELVRELGAQRPSLLEFQSVITAFGHLPGNGEKDPERVLERSRDKEIYKKQLASVYASSREIQDFIDGNVALFGGTPGAPESYDLLHNLLETQAYRLAFWRVAAEEINYRRFFDINELAALRMENEAVFEKTHELVLRLIRDGMVQGLRVDHPDGLYNPRDYFLTLQDRITKIRLEKKGITLIPELVEEVKKIKPFYIVAEKILAPHEDLPETWPVHGTTGYEFCRLVDGLFVDPAAEERLTRAYSRFIGSTPVFDEVVYERKKQITRLLLAGQLNVLATMLRRISDSDRHTRDFTLNNLRDAIKEVAASFPTYRTYITGDAITPEDRRQIDWAVGQGRKRSRTADRSIFDFVRDVLLLEEMHRFSERFVAAATVFTMKFQQFTSPLAAKGMEDTAFYIYNRLTSLNEVGGDPSRFGVSVQAFHHANLERLKRWPDSMLLTSSHDSKRSADVRMRINVLTEMPSEWRASVGRWSRMNLKNKREVDGEPAPSRNDEYLFYQTLAGAWPPGRLAEGEMAAFTKRVEAYMTKAAREAKVHMSWINPNKAYEDALSAFVRSTLEPDERNPFMKDFAPFAATVGRMGLFNSLSQTLLKLTSPGVPDLYQGDEIASFRLVDPDNRGQVDYNLRGAMLGSLKKAFGDGTEPKGGAARGLLESGEDGRLKMFLIWRVLNFRRHNAELYAGGDYRGLTAAGPKDGHVVAFARRLGDDAAVTVAPRFFFALTGGGERLPVGDAWEDTRVESPDLTPREFRNVLTGERFASVERDGKHWIRLADVLRDFPVAVAQGL